MVLENKLGLTSSADLAHEKGVVGSGDICDFRGSLTCSFLQTPRIGSFI